MYIPRTLFKQSASSSRWLQRQTNDPFVRSRINSPLHAQQGTLRSRSAFKLISLAKSYPLLGQGRTVVDLGAAPGGWSQVAVSTGCQNVIAVDINHIDPVPGATFIQGDFLSHEIQQKVLELVKGDVEKDEKKVDTVLSDMMAPMSGVRLKDVAASLDLVSAATSFGIATLRVGTGEVDESVKGRKIHDGGNMVLKFFMHPDLDEFKKEELMPRFGKVLVDKPKESRKESSEAYFVCLGFKG